MANYTKRDELRAEMRAPYLPAPERGPAPAKKPYRAPMGPVPTLAAIRKECPWVRVFCINRAGYCSHKTAMAIAPFIIRWGPGASSDLIRNRLRCTRCGHLGAMIQTPTTARVEDGFPMFPAPCEI